jgi:hypothetical protein
VVSRRSPGSSTPASRPSGPRPRRAVADQAAVQTERLRPGGQQAKHRLQTLVGGGVSACHERFLPGIAGWEPQARQGRALTSR